MGDVASSETVFIRKCSPSEETIHLAHAASFFRLGTSDRAAYGNAQLVVDAVIGSVVCQDDALRFRPRDTGCWRENHFSCFERRDCRTAAAPA